jgi:tetratricopeptide (TPR) repeat protein
LIKSSLPWRYEGVLHEYLTCDAPYQSEILDGPLVFGHFDGGRSQGIDQKTKYERDAKLLELELRKDPKNSRNVFYLAQSHRDCGQFAKALEAYQRRVDMGGWEEEIWYSLLQIAIMSERLQEPESQIVPRYLDAYQYRPSRAEPLVYLATLYRNAGKHALAYLVASMARQIERPSDLLFLDQSCYMWRALDEYSIACYYTGRYEESRLACQSLLEGSRLPASERERVLQNLEFASNQPGSP